MPANLTPQYREAEARYRAAQTPAEQLAALEEMWRELPKHKSTEKMQAELKRRLSALRKEMQAGGRKSGTGGKVDPFAIPRTGAAQVALVGTPNVGKSSIVGALTHAHVRIADYPFSTELPVPGMVPFEDIQIELVDTPPVTGDHVPTGSAGLWHAADALVIVADLAAETCVDDVATCLRLLAERHIEPVDGPRVHPRETGAALRVPTLVLANKADVPGTDVALELLRESLAGSAPGRPGGPLRVEPVSTRDPASLARVPRLLFELVRVVRVYTKPPGRKPDLAEPFVLPAGSDVHALARRVFGGRDVRVRATRIWGTGVADGQNVMLDHVLHDRDVVELHT